jgi:hypothetical protein
MLAPLPRPSADRPGTIAEVPCARQSLADPARVLMNRKRIIALLLLTLGHAVLSFGLFLISFSHSLSRFDMRAAEPKIATAGERALEVVVEILLWPLFAPLTQFGGRWVNAVFPGLLGYIPLLLNSFVWALGILFLWRLVRGRSRRAGLALGEDR